jgi:lipopolysaccharide/colanic/teichoic acid biosynthesis glycosyltransferase
VRLRLPSSRGSFRARVSFPDTAWAIFSPLLALYFRDAQILSYEDLTTTFLYCGLSVFFSLVTFSAFRIQDGMTRYFSVHDALDVAKAVGLAALLTYVVVFTLTRLQGVPRSTPVIHALILVTGLIGMRISARLFEAKRTAPNPRGELARERILLIGSNRLSSLYIKFIRAYSPGLHQIMAVLDDRPEMIGRAIEGVRVIGPLDHLEAVVNEFAEHGIRISHVIVGGDPEMVSPVALSEIRRVCDTREVRLDFVPELMGLQRLLRTNDAQDVETNAPVLATPPPVLSTYFVVKRFLDLLVAIAALVVFSPVWAVLCLVALWDVGSPIFFWQQRLGQGGQPFLLHKIRTLKPIFDWCGRKIPEAERLSAIGRLLRKYRLDEGPQLLNVLVGDMSLIGPRPLLPRDQPCDPSVRLSVRPGITGWAQVNGGKLLAPEEKDALDEWYIRNASFWLDLRILFMTVHCVFKGEHLGEAAITEAFAVRRRQAYEDPIFAAPRASNAVLRPQPLGLRNGFLAVRFRYRTRKWLSAQSMPAGTRLTR